MMLGLAITLVVLLVAGGTMAWFTATAETATNSFTAGTVKIELYENDMLIGGENTGLTFTNVNPGDCYVKEVYVKNTGTKRVMVRVHVSALIQGFTASNDNPNPDIGIVKFDVHENWEYDAATQHYYYKNVLLPGTETEPILVDNKICFDGEGMGNEYQGATFDIILNADAIQATNNAPTTEGWKFDPLYVTPGL